jgi:uncharacterized OsmC-like protein
MATGDLAQALHRAESTLRRRPDLGLHDDAPATARWVSGTRTVARHGNGMQMTTDMPGELGGSGDQVTPGWLFRAGLASCTATAIAIAAAAQRIELAALEVRATSRSDTRGLLGMSDADGARVDAAPTDVRLHVRISAPGVAPARLRTLAEAGCRCSPIAGAIASALPVDVVVDIA